MLSVPMFHALGFAQAMVGIGLGSTLVVHRRFDPEETLDSLERHQATAMVVVPVMLQRIARARRRRDRRSTICRSLRIIFVCGSALGAELAGASTEAFGPVIYNLYGSTEVAYATIATPDDLERGARHGRQGRYAAPSSRSSTTTAPSCRRARPDGSSSATAPRSRATPAAAARTQIDGLMASGDVGHFDEQGRLFIEGRDDEMIVSGGENVFPAEVEELLAGHEAIVEAAVIGVDDERFGQRLQGVRRDPRRPPADRGRGQGLRPREPRRYKTPREVVFIDAAAAQPDRQGPQARAGRGGGQES